MGSHSSPVDSDPADPLWRAIEDVLDEIAELANKSTAEALKILQDRMQTGLTEIRESVAKGSSEDRS